MSKTRSTRRRAAAVVAAIGWTLTAGGALAAEPASLALAPRISFSGGTTFPIGMTAEASLSVWDRVAAGLTVGLLPASRGVSISPGAALGLFGSRDHTNFDLWVRYSWVFAGTPDFIVDSSLETLLPWALSVAALTVLGDPAIFFTPDQSIGAVSWISGGLGLTFPQPGEAFALRLELGVAYLARGALDPDFGEIMPAISARMTTWGP
ncbi:hypothetical protein L6R52_10880 [Myxococcota bacterium]|nr:hypothetical protein [Myxococcota bacterium]